MMSKTEKTKRSFEERLSLLLAFLLPILIMLGVFAGKSIYPFGDNSFLRTDLYHQYAPFFQSFAEKLKDGASLTYAWDIGLGSNYTALFAYYLCAPLHFLAFLIPEGFIIEFVTYLIVLKIGFSGLSFAWYLSKRFETRHIGITFCGVCYALSGYMAAYSWNIMWLDVLWLAPIVLWGLERLVRENKPFLYCVALSLSIFCNYYICIMLCIFLVLYFICQLVLLPKTSLRGLLLKLFNFGFFSLIAGGMAAVLLMPAAKALMTTAAANTSFPKNPENYFALLDMLSRHLLVVQPEIGLDHWPNLYSGVAVFLLLPLYYMSKDVSYREKIVNTVLLFFMLLSYSMNFLNYIWHGFHYPNSLPARQSFLYTIVLLTMAFRGLLAIDKTTKGRLVGCLWGAIAFVLVVEVTADPAEIPYYACYATILFLGLYALVGYLYKTRRASSLTAATFVICILIIEMGLNTAVTSVTTVNRTEYLRYNKVFGEFADIAESGRLFTRVERQKNRTKNDGTLMGYNSASIFSSTTNAAVTEFYKDMGFEGNTNAYSFTGATPLSSSMLSVSHIIATQELPESKLYKQVAASKDTSGKDVYLYENLYTLPLGFLLPLDSNTAWDTNQGNPARVQNSFINVTTGLRNVLETVDGNASGNDYNIFVKESGQIFVYVSNSSVKTVTANIGSERKEFKDVNRRYLLDLGYCNAGINITLSADSDVALSAVAYRFNEDIFIDAYEMLSEKPFTISAFNNTLWDTSIVGTVSCDEPMLLYTSIPYEKGWKAYMDGYEVTTEAFAGAFISLPVTAGTHEIRLVYVPDGLVTGAMISLISLGLLLLAALISLLISLLRRKKEEAHKEEEELPPVCISKERMQLIHELDVLAENEDAAKEEELLRDIDTFVADSSDDENFVIHADSADAEVIDKDILDEQSKDNPAAAGDDAPNQEDKL